MEEERYPKFISNLPCGNDYTEGRAQERLASAIAKHIKSTDDSQEQIKTPRIIGLKGSWGTGKSNVIKQLENQVKDDYYVFEYDAWGHQEDLQRRSFLETLTQQLLDNPKYKDYLSKDKCVVKSWEVDRKITWQDKLNELLAHKRITDNKSIPVFNGGAFWTVMFLLLTPISTFIAERLESQEILRNIPILALIAFSPIIIGIIIWLLTMIRNKDARQLGYLLKISKGETTCVKNYETINENEPTVAKFNRWMKDLSDYISNYKKPKLIIVYDNMDRLPSEKVKDLWSSIHTFFAENGFPNIWVIIPFDEKHLSCAFGENDDKDQLTKHFISKTFPIVYRVTPPVFTDYKKMFYDLYEQAFGTTEETDKETIFRIFHLEKLDSTIREMIEFVNSLVALKQLWGEEIDLKYCTIFAIKENDVAGNGVCSNKNSSKKDSNKHKGTIENHILSGDYLNDLIKTIIPNDETLQANIAAIVYGVKKELAEQIPMTKYIESCFDTNKNDINKYSHSSKFISMLQKVIHEADPAKTDSIINSLGNLNIESLNDNDAAEIENLWEKLSTRKQKLGLQKQEVDNSFKILLSHVSDKINVITFLCKQLQEFNNESFSGTSYYNSLKDLENFITENHWAIDIALFLSDLQKDVSTYVQYVLAAKEDYKRFKLKTNNKQLNSYFLNKKDDKANELLVLKYVVSDNEYNFNALKNRIEDFIPSADLSSKNFKQIFDAYKVLSEEKPLKTQLNRNQINQIWNETFRNQQSEEFWEIATIRLANLENLGMNLSEEQIKYIAQQLDYYGNYGDLLLNSNNPNLNVILKYMTENQLGQSLSLGKILPQFFNIKQRIGVTEEALLTQLNRWNSSKSIVSKDNIQSIINGDLYQFTKTIENELSSHINTIAIEKLTCLDLNTLRNEINNASTYWFKVVYNLIDTSFCKVLPDNLFSLGNSYLIEIASNGNIPKQNDIKAKIIKKLDENKIGSTIIEIRNSFCNSHSSITKQKFIYFEKWLRLYGNLSDRNNDVIHRIIEPIITDKECLDLIVSNADFYINLINNAGDEATVIKQKLQDIVDGSTDSSILNFAKSLGISKTIPK